LAISWELPVKALKPEYFNEEISKTKAATTSQWNYSYIKYHPGIIGAKAKVNAG
jgi:hypothetical protein